MALEGTVPQPGTNSAPRTMTSVEAVVVEGAPAPMNAAAAPDLGHVIAHAVNRNRHHHRQQKHHARRRPRKS